MSSRPRRHFVCLVLGVLSVVLAGAPPVESALILEKINTGRNAQSTGEMLAQARSGSDRFVSRRAVSR